MQLEYSLDQKVPFLKSILFGVQWAALLVSTVIILGKVVVSIHFPDGSGMITYLQKLLFISAITMFCQIYWGHRLPLIPGPSAVLLIGVIASQGFDMSTIYTSILIGGLFITILALSGLFGFFQRLFTNNVVSVVLLLIAFPCPDNIKSYDR